MARSLAVALGLAVAACGGSAKPTATTPVPVDAPPVEAAEASRVDVLAPVSCAAGTACEAKLVVHALGDFKVNAEYPTKFIADAGSATTTAQFTPADKMGTLTLSFTASSPGPTKIAGTFKYSVCTEDVCNIEEPKIAFTVP